VKPAFCRLPLVLGGLLLPWVLLVGGCDSIPGGASISSPGDANAPIMAEVPAPQLRFTAAATAVTVLGIVATAAPEDVDPVLYYRYRVDTQVNGNYIGMPYPPTLYTVTRYPFYQAEPDPIVVKLDLQNNSTDVVHTTQAICAFDLNGQTVFTTPLEPVAVLPGHAQSLAVTGPPVDKFKTAPSGTMTIWLYGLAGNDKSKVFRWDIPYSYSEAMRHEPVEVIGSTKNEDEAKPYEGKVERAHPAVAAPTPAGSGSPL